MKRSTVLMIMLLAPNLAQAFPAFDILKNKVAISGSSKARSMVADEGPTSCTNFSGTWTGTCTDSQGSHAETTTVVQQNCDYITVDERYFPVGGIVSESSNSATYASSVSYSLYWNSDETVMTMAIGGLFKTIDVKQAPVDFNGSMAIALNASGQLTVNGSVLGVSTSCTYNKK